MMRWKGAVAATLLAVMGATAPAPADACMRMKKRRVQAVDQKLQDVNRAEHLLAKGDAKRAVKTAKRRFKNFTAASGRPDKGKALFNRAQRTIALATVRADGAMDLGRGMRGTGVEGKALNLAWATSVLQVQSAAEPDNLLLRTYYAEALTHHSGGESQARDILAQLSNDDLMPTARGYAVLAQTQEKLGDVSGRDLSLQRCRDLGEGDDICSVA